jgi:uncharacterized paraquat-inducible protein A
MARFLKINNHGPVSEPSLQPPEYDLLYCESCDWEGTEPKILKTGDVICPECGQVIFEGEF